MITYRNSLQNVRLLRILRSVFEIIGTNKSHINQTIRLWSLTFHSMTLFGNSHIVKGKTPKSCLRYISKHES